MLDIPVIGRDREHAASIVEQLRGRSAAAAFARQHHAGTADDHIGRYRLLAERGVTTVFVALPDLAEPDDVLRLAPVAAAFADGGRRPSGTFQALEAVGHRAEQRVGECGQGRVHRVDPLVGAGSSCLRAELVAGGDHRRRGLVPVRIDAVADGGADGRAEAGGVADRGAAGRAVEDVGDDLHHQV